MRPLASREGDDYVFTWPQDRVAMVLAELREHGGDLYAELTVYDVGEDGQRYHVTGPLKQNLLGSTARTTTAKVLATRDEQDRPADAWGTLVEQAFALTVRAHRAGAPLVCLNGTVEAAMEREMLLRPLLVQRETTMIYADGASGKSYLALCCALAVTTGQPLAGGLLRPVGSPCPVLYCDWETSERAVHRRWALLAAGLGIPVPALYYLRLQRPLTQEATRIRRALSECAAGLVIVDSLGFASEQELKDAEAATRMFGAMNSFERATLALHHISKDALKQKQGRAEAFGTIYFRNATRNAWELRAASDGRNLAMGLWHRKANEGPLYRGELGLGLAFEESAVRLTRTNVRDIEELDARRSTIDRVCDALRRGPMTVRELAAAELGSEDSLAVTLSRWNGRRVTRLERGVWALRAADGTEAVPF